MDYFNKMDGAGAYVRTNLLGFNQGLNPLHDPLRLHALQSQISDSVKDGPGLLRPHSDYPHLHPFLPFSPPIFASHLDLRLPFSHGAFHPLHHKLPQVPPSSMSNSTSSTSNNTISASTSLSAFAPLPSKVSKMDSTALPSSVASTGLFTHPNLLASLEHRSPFLGGPSPPLVPGGPLSEERRDSPSPRGSHGSRESPGQPRESSTPTSPGEDMRVRKSRPPGETWCPDCGMTLRPGELESHLGQELEKLVRIHLNRTHLQRPSASTPSSVGGLANSPHSPLLPPPMRGRDSGWETYQRVRANRQVRLRTKKRRSGRGDDAACPFCGEKYPPEDLQGHIEHCVVRRACLMQGFMPPNPSATANDEEDIDVGCDYEELELFGQRRVKVPFMLRGTPGQLQANREREDEPMADKDSTEKSSADAEGGADNRTGTHGGTEENGAGTGTGPSDIALKEERICKEELEKENEMLREEIRSLKNKGTPVPVNKLQCRACANENNRPVVSVSCWHVLCETCWPISVDSKQECPVCSKIFNPEDLKPIHL